MQSCALLHRPARLRIISLGYRPHLPANLVAGGILSDAQLESVIYAGEAHSEFLAGSWTVDVTFDVVAAALKVPARPSRKGDRARNT